MVPQLARARRYVSGIENANPNRSAAAAHKTRPPTPGSPRFLGEKARRRQKSLKVLKTKKNRQNKINSSTESRSAEPGSCSPSTTTGSPIFNFQLPSPADTCLEVDMDDLSMASRNAEVKLPRHLPQPPPTRVCQETLEAIDSEFRRMPVEYYVDQLSSYSKAMRDVLETVKANPDPSRLSDFIDVLVENSPDLPTHMLAIHDPAEKVSPTQKKHVTLYPIHNPVVASQCANLPALPLVPTPPLVVDPHQVMMQLPICHLGIPSPEAFAPLMDYLYLHDIGTVADYTLPAFELDEDDSDSDSDSDEEEDELLSWKRSVARRVSSQLAQEYAMTPEILLAHCQRTLSMYRNVVALGVWDSRLWTFIDMSWEILIVALGRIQGKDMKVEF